MRVLQEFEHRLEGAVEGFFARLFRSGVQPVELAKAIQRYARDQQHVTAEGVVVPNVYRVTVGPKDHDRLQGFGASLPRELAEVVVRTAGERGWLLRGPAKVRMEVADDLRLGRYRLTARIEVVDGAPAAPPAASATPPPPEVAVDRVADRDDRAPLQHTQIVERLPDGGPHLVVRHGGTTEGASLALRGSRLTIGRLASCDLAIEDTTVSREHAAVVRRGDTWWVVDLGSTNGTRVNGTRAAEHPLEPGDRIALGDAVVELIGG